MHVATHGSYEKVDRDPCKRKRFIDVSNKHTGTRTYAPAGQS